eukprot:190375_1
MEAVYLLFTAIYGITSVKSVRTVFDYNHTSAVCSVQECASCCFNDCNCTDLVPITGTLAQQYISNTDGSCMSRDSCGVSEWLWPNAYYNDPPSSTDSTCICPKCSCDTLDSIQYVKKVENSCVTSDPLYYATCYNCSCEEQSWSFYGNGSANVRGYSCKSLTHGSFVSDSEAASFPCPPAYCGTATGIIQLRNVYEGDTWWDDSDASKYCLCQSDATALCSQSYDEILSNPLLNEKFDKDCAVNLRGTCRTDPSLWFKIDGYFRFCPLCACDTAGDVDYFTETDDDGGKDCYECTCEAIPAHFGMIAIGNINGYDCSYSPIYSLNATELETKSWSCPPNPETTPTSNNPETTTSNTQQFDMTVYSLFSLSFLFF